MNDYFDGENDFVRVLMEENQRLREEVQRTRAEARLVVRMFCDTAEELLEHEQAKAEALRWRTMDVSKMTCEEIEEALAEL